MREAFGQAGFAKCAHHRDKLLPCPVGTFVNPSARDPNDLKCRECPAGEFFFFLFSFLFFLDGVGGGGGGGGGAHKASKSKVTTRKK